RRSSTTSAGPVLPRRLSYYLAIVLHSHARSGLSLDLDGRDRPALARSLRTIARPGWSRSSCTRTLAPDYRSTSPRMKDSSWTRPSESSICTGGDFMKYVEADRIGPPTPRSFAIFAARMASMMMPAELG